MPSYQSLIDHPDRYFSPDDVYVQGNSPAALAALQQFLTEKADQLSELYICVERFNNAALHELLLSLSNDGVKVNLITQPIAALSDENMVGIKNLMTGQVDDIASAKSPYALARPIFAEHYKTIHPNFKLHFFPHLNIKDSDGNPFEKGQQPYSLANNVILLLYKSSGGAVIYNTADLSIGDPVVESPFLIVEENWGLLKTTHRFFQALLRNAVPLKHFDFKRKYNDLILRAEEISQDETGFYTAPFLKESTAFAEMVITKLVKAAKQRIWIYSPEVSAYEYVVDGRFHENYENELIEHYGFLRPVLEMASGGVEVKCLAKVYHTKAAGAFYNMAKFTANVTLKGDTGIGCSFMLIDNCLLLSNGSFEPDAFIYLDDVQIEKFEEAPTENFTGIYAKMRQYLQVEDEEVVKQFEKKFERCWEQAAWLR